MPKETRLNTIEHTIVINRPIEDVFRFVHDPKNDPSWQTTLIECQQVEEGPVGVGTQLRERRRFLGIQVEMTREITEYEPSTSSAFKYVAGGAPMSGEYRLERLDGGTRLTVIGYVESRGFFKWAEPLFTSMAGRELQASRGHLKDLLEVGRGQILLEEPQ